MYRKKFHPLRPATFPAKMSDYYAAMEAWRLSQIQVQENNNEVKDSQSALQKEVERCNNREK